LLRTWLGTPTLSFRGAFMRMALVVVACCSLISAGCGGSTDKWKKDRPQTVPATGKVTLNGEPLEGAQVVLVSKSGSHGASALSAKDGSFHLATFPPDDGVVAGSYKVMVVKSLVPEIQEPGEDSTVMTVAKLLVPKKYTSPETSGISIDIPPAGKKDLHFELTGDVGK
jgi:hypothetical protein